jgi:hypothetical protein
MRANEITMPPSRGIAPPLSPVPAPRPTIGIPKWLEICTMAATSSELQIFGLIQIAAPAQQIVDVLLSRGS